MDATTARGFFSPSVDSEGHASIVPLSAAGWSSLVARRAHNPKVVGSNPAPATTSVDRFRRPWVSPGGVCFSNSNSPARTLQRATYPPSGKGCIWIPLGPRSCFSASRTAAGLSSESLSRELTISTSFFPRGHRWALRLRSQACTPRRPASARSWSIFVELWRGRLAGASPSCESPRLSAPAAIGSSDRRRPATSATAACRGCRRMPSQFSVDLLADERHAPPAAGSTGPSVCEDRQADRGLHHRALVGAGPAVAARRSRRRTVAAWEFWMTMLAPHAAAAKEAGERVDFPRGRTPPSRREAMARASLTFTTALQVTGSTIAR
jgi:hypothetical protein